MKVIKPTLIFLFLMLVYACTNNDIDKTFDNEDQSFVRFFLLVDNNNSVLEYPEVNGGLIPVSEYAKNTFRTLKVPVALTTDPLPGNVTVNYESEISGLNGVTIEPANTLTFTPTKLVDTIFVTFSERWDESINPQLKLQLISASDSRINIGMPNSTAQNDELTINFEALNFSYRFPSPNQQEIIGSLGEVVNFSVEFSNGYVASEVDGIDLFSETLSNFNYSLVQLPLINPTKVDYALTVNDDIQIDELEFKSVFTLNDLEGYVLNGSTNFTIRKPIVTIRDNAVFTSNNFYNLDDPFNRTYGEHWFDSNEDGICAWQSYTTFTYPVVVSSDHPNAVLFDDMGTSDPDDDVYHHAFRIGFKSPNSVATTNPFNLKRWFNNEATNQSTSPGFEIPEALEFFPADGTSTTEGFVQVIEQDLLITSNTGTQHIIAISGSGSYSEISPGLFEIQLELNATNNELFGGTRTDIYRIYNSNSFPDLSDLNEICKIPIDL
jgi:hypothetical protein